MPRSKFSPYEERILRVLARGRRKLTTSQVSYYSSISYNTTKSKLNTLYQKGVVKRRISGNRIYWWF